MTAISAELQKQSGEQMHNLIVSSTCPGLVKGDCIGASSPYSHSVFADYCLQGLLSPVGSVQSLPRGAPQRPRRDLISILYVLLLFIDASSCISAGT